MTEKTRNSLDFLKLITDELDKNNIPYWLECGTLLGAYRNNSFIEYDNDIDIGILNDYSNNVNSVIDELSSNSYIEKLKYVHNGELSYDKIIKVMYKKDGIISNCRWMDIYFFRKNKDRIESCLFSDDTTSRFQANLYQIENLETINLEDCQFKCPKNVSKFLKVRYGEDFMIPQSRCNSLDKEWWQVDDDLGKQYLD